MRLSLVPSFMLALAMCAPAQARVTAFEIESRTPYGRFNGIDFVRIEARVRGELEKGDPIPELDAALAAEGKGRYSTKVLLVAPERRANGMLLVEVPNRGRVISFALYNGPREPAVGVGSTDPGTGFLQREGLALASVTWEYGEGFVPPTFRDASGQVKNVEAAAFAAIRDVALFLRDARSDDEGRPNPLLGFVDRALVTGFSQTARFLRTFLAQGFNTHRGRIVFSGLHLHAGASGQMPILVPGTGAKSATASATPNVRNPDLRGVQEPPFTYADIAAAMKARGEPAPKIVVTNMTTDYLSIRASLARTGVDGGTKDLPLPENVRMYDVAGAAHSLNTAASHPDCEKPLGRLDYRPVMRSSMINLQRWVSGADEPPPSALMPLVASDDPSLLGAPKHLPQAKVLAPARDRDGNYLGGIRLPEVAAPLGVHGAQNAPLTAAACRLSASFVSFGGDRVAARYGSRAEYVRQIEAASAKLVSARTLLPEDALEINRAARSMRWGE